MLETAINNREKLMAAFQRQAADLMRKNYDILAGGRRQEFSRALDRLKEHLRISSRINRIRFHRENIPCLIAIPQSVISLASRMRYKKWKTKDGPVPGGTSQEIDRDYRSPRFVPDFLYLVFDVEIGSLWKGDVVKARMDFQRLERRGLVPEEGIAMIEYDESIIERRPLFLIGSGVCYGGGVPVLRKYQTAGLEYINGSVNHHFGIPSCSNVILR